MRRLLAALSLVAACAVTITLSAGGLSSAESGSYSVILDNAFGLVEGADFRVGGVRAGRIESIDLQTAPAQPPRAAVSVETTEPGIELRRDASCRVRLQSLIGEYFLDCQPGSSPEPLAEGTAVPVEKTESTIPLDLVQNILRRPARERLRLLLTSLGMGVAGRPEDIQAVLRRAHPGLRETSKVLRILGEQQRVIEAFVRDADTVVSAVAVNRRDARRFIEEAADTTEIAASHREPLREGVRRLPGFLRELRPTMVRLRQVADRGLPLAAGLRRAAPDVEGLLARLDPFATQARPALQALGEAALPATQALREGRQEVAELRRLATDAPGLAKPLRQLLDTLDDRRRASEDDARAARTGPPEPDPTHTDGPAGFTGFEAIANYLFWQAMTTNGFDSLGHLIRIVASFDTDCSPYVNRALQDEEDARVYRECNSWLGPNQPGLTAPDPSTPNSASLRERSGKRATHPGEQARPGEPESGPLPGQPDLSQPRIVLPPALQDLLRGLPGLGVSPGALPPLDLPPDGGGQELLDYLLGP